MRCRAMSEAPVDAGVLWLRSWAVQVRMGAGAQTEGLGYRSERAGPGPPQKDAPPGPAKPPERGRSSPSFPSRDHLELLWASSRLGDEARLRSLWAGQKGAPGLDVSWVSANWRPFWAHPLVERVPVLTERRRLRSSANGLVIALLESDSRGNSQHAEPLGISQWGLGGAATASFRGWAGVRGARKACSGRRIPFGPPLRGPAPQPPPRGPGKGISEPGRLQPVKPPPRRGNSPGSENIHGSGPG